VGRSIRSNRAIRGRGSKNSTASVAIDLALTFSLKKARSDSEFNFYIFSVSPVTDQELKLVWFYATWRGSLGRQV